MNRIRRLELISRLGFAARGIVYLLVGWFAVRAALTSGSPTDTKGALQSMHGEPFGQFLLAAMALGLLAYAVFRFVEAALDLENHGNEPKGLMVRAGHLISGLLHVGLALYAVSLVLGIGIGGSGDGTQSLTAWLLSQPYGRWLVMAVGIGVIVAGVMQLRKAWQATFMRNLSLAPGHGGWVRPTGRLGFAARSVVFALIGLFLLVAGWASDPSEAGGLGAALRSLQEQPYGPWLLGAVAVGLALFGVFCFVEAAYRRITDEEVLARLRSFAA